MSRKSTTILLISAALMTAGVACQSNDEAGAGARAGGGADARSASADQKGGAQVWAENCSRCHNLRPPQSYSDAQWQTVVHHMRLRANLTGQEQVAITEFLQASR